MVPLFELFDIWYGVNLEYVNCTPQSNGIPFVSRTSQNNGIVGYVAEVDGIIPNPKNSISIACGGSVLSTFYHHYDYYSGRDVYILKPKCNLTPQEMLFYCAAIEKNKYKYNYGRQANKTLKDIKVPSLGDIPKIVKKASVEIPFECKPLLNKKIVLNTKAWKQFSLCELFDIFTSQDNNLTDSLQGVTPYISSSQDNNGISGYVDTLPTIPANTISVARNGSVGSAFYHHYDYCASPDDVRIFQAKFPLNKYIAMFFLVLIEKEKYRFAYGRKFGTKRMNETKISIPVNNEGVPDFQYMESYVKSLPYSQAI